MILTGTLEAVRAQSLSAPEIRVGQLQIRWMEEDGALVREGQKVHQFDNAAFASDLEENKLAANKQDLVRQDPGVRVRKAKAKAVTSLGAAPG